jgi:hypothetical protein
VQWALVSAVRGGLQMLIMLLLLLVVVGMVLDWMTLRLRLRLLLRIGTGTCCVIVDAEHDRRDATRFVRSVGCVRHWTFHVVRWRPAGGKAWAETRDMFERLPTKRCLLLFTFHARYHPTPIQSYIMADAPIVEFTVSPVNHLSNFEMPCARVPRRSLLWFGRDLYD